MALQGRPRVDLRKILEFIHCLQGPGLPSSTPVTCCSGPSFCPLPQSYGTRPLRTPASFHIIDYRWHSPGPVQGVLDRLPALFSTECGSAQRQVASSLL